VYALLEVYAQPKAQYVRVVSDVGVNIGVLLILSVEDINSEADNACIAAFNVSIVVPSST